MTSLQREVKGLRRDLAGKASAEDVAAVQKELVAQLREMKEEIFLHFDAALENIEETLKGANADEISLLGDVREDHELRIGTLEKQAGLR